MCFLHSPVTIPDQQGGGDCNQSEEMRVDGVCKCASALWSPPWTGSPAVSFPAGSRPPVCADHKVKQGCGSVTENLLASSEKELPVESSHFFMMRKIH